MTRCQSAHRIEILADDLCQREFVILVTFVIASGTKRLSCGSTACLTIHAHACWN